MLLLLSTLTQSAYSVHVVLYGYIITDILMSKLEIKIPYAEDKVQNHCPNTLTAWRWSKPTCSCSVPFDLFLRHAWGLLCSDHSIQYVRLYR